MALYVGGKKVKINLNGVAYKLQFIDITKPTDKIVMRSSDGMILKDVNGLYLTVKEEGAEQ